jgi:hypothetical protein
MKARGELFDFPIGFIRSHPETFISRRKRSAVGFQPSAKDEQKQLDALVSGFKNNIEKFNVEPGGQNGGPAAAGQNRREMQRNASIPLLPQRNARPLGKGL